MVPQSEAVLWSTIAPGLLNASWSFLLPFFLSLCLAFSPAVRFLYYLAGTFP